MPTLPKLRCCLASVALALLSVGPACAFSPTASSSVGISRDRRVFFVKTTLNDAANKNEDGLAATGWSYGERSRQFRRDVFGYDDWVAHRSTDRFIGNLIDILKSGVFRELVPKCLLTSSVATFVCLYNALLVAGFDDFSGAHHAALLADFGLMQQQQLPILKMPAEFFSLCTPSLALLLGKSRRELSRQQCPAPRLHALRSLVSSAWC